MEIKNFLIPPYPLTNIEIQKYYQNKTTFSGVYSRGNFSKKNEGWGLCNKS